MANSRLVSPEYRKDIFDQIAAHLRQINLLLLTLVEPASRNRINRKITQTQKALRAYEKQWILPLKKSLGI